jgi:hypothetical protein
MKKLLTLSRKKFSHTIFEKDKKLSQFFKMPKHKIEKQVFDRDQLSVLNTFNDQDYDKIDLLTKVLKQKEAREHSKVNQFFKNVTNNQEQIKITENLVEKMKLNKEFKYTEDYKQKEILNEYGNYDKYFAGFDKKVTEKEYHDDDDGRSTWEQRFSELKEKYTNPFDRESAEEQQKNREKKLMETINTYGDKFTFIDYMKFKAEDEEFVDVQTTNPRTDFQDKKDNRKKRDSIIKAQVPRRRRRIKELTPEDLAIPHKIREKLEAKQKIKELEKRLYNTEGYATQAVIRQALKEQKEVIPVLSPAVREEIYHMYLEGWTVRDLAYKYGILPERVKAVVWLRHQFWKVVYPKIGESGYRERLRECEEYDRKIGFVDYGIDLEMMAEREQGKKIHQLTRSELDIRPTKESEARIADAIGKTRGKGHDHVPIGFIGKGPKGYLIKELVVRRGIGSKRVSEMFKKFMHNKDRNEHILPRKVMLKKELGPRLATMGYRF